ncbi:MAG: AAA family ATPase [Azoarcus sp.]|jgi:type II secretory pathway predicted ATPase ExeA|nr:AAA family ATPase [Azoarcus sp.]
MKPARVSIREIARRAGVDPAVARRALRGVFPARDQSASSRLRAALADVSTPAPAAPPDDDLHGVQIEKSLAPRCSNTGGPVSAAKPDENLTEEGRMLIPKPTITPAARQAWRLRPDVFSPPAAREDVFLGGEMRAVYEHMLAKARHGGLLAVVGESGAGKSTLKDLLVTDLATESEVIVIEPHTQRMEENDKAGKTLKGADIVEAIMGEIAPAQRIHRAAEAALKQVAVALAGSQAASRNRRHLLVIEEAHCLPKPTLRHLKRFLEMKNPAVKGLQRPMLAILLLGQPELADRLSPFDPSVREVWQRCETVHLPPLGQGLEAYVRHRLGQAAQAIESGAIAELAQRLTARGGQSLAYPLAVDNWLAAILNASAGLGGRITAAHVAEALRGMP